MVNVRIRGIDTTIRNLVRTNDYVYDDARKGVNEAAEYLLKCVKERFGSYQKTGGDPGGKGPWKRLSMAYRFRKARKYGKADNPLIASGETLNSFSVKEGGKGRLAASVHSDSDVLIYHIYGAPGAGVPMRDPIRITAIEERDACHDIIENYINRAIRSAGL